MNNWLHENTHCLEAHSTKRVKLVVNNRLRENTHTLEVHDAGRVRLW